MLSASTCLVDKPRNLHLHIFSSFFLSFFIHMTLSQHTFTATTTRWWMWHWLLCHFSFKMANVKNYFYWTFLFFWILTPVIYVCKWWINTLYCTHTNGCDDNMWAGLTSSLVALVTRSIKSLRTFLLLPKTVHPLIRSSGGWTLQGATYNLCLLVCENTHTNKTDKHASTRYIKKTLNIL